MSLINTIALFKIHNFNQMVLGKIFIILSEYIKYRLNALEKKMKSGNALQNTLLTERKLTLFFAKE